MAGMRRAGNASLAIGMFAKKGKKADKKASRKEREREKKLQEEKARLSEVLAEAMRDDRFVGYTTPRSCGRGVGG